MVSRAASSPSPQLRLRGGVSSLLFRPVAEALNRVNGEPEWDPDGNEGMGEWKLDVDWPEKQNFMLFEGRAGTAKTFGICHWIRFMCETFPGLRVLVLRKERRRLTNSWMVTWEDKVLGHGHPALGGASRENRSAYYFPVGENGRQSTVVLMDLSDPEKTFSSEWDIVVLNEVVEIPDADSVAALWRGIRGGVGPIQAIIMDCNPGNEFHWANQKALDGTILRVVTSWEDNPLWFKRTGGQWKLDIDTCTWEPVTDGGPGYTDKGKKFVTALGKNLTPHMRRRLYLGLWGSAVGMILHTYRPEKNRLDYMVAQDQRTKEWLVKMPEGHPLGEVKVEMFVAGYDWGDASPGSLQLWAVDGKHRMYLVHEVYYSGKNADWWADIAMDWHERYRLEAIYCDDAAKDAIYLFNKRLAAKNKRGEAIAREAKKGHVEPGNDRVRFMFMEDPHGIPRLFLRPQALQEGVDPTLEGKPTCLEQEIPGYCYREQKPGDPIHEMPARDSVDHACDAMRYAVINVARMDGWEEPDNQGWSKAVDHYGRPLPGFDELEAA